jgi:hypothetical protein
MTAPQSAAAAFIAARFPACSAAFLGGSVVRGEATATSDLDIVVVSPADHPTFRALYRFMGWPVEVFTYTAETLRAWWAKDVAMRLPKLPLMCAEGIILRDGDGLATALQAEAKQIIAAGPPPLTSEEITRLRYALTDVMDDLHGSERPAETLLVAAQVAEYAADLILGQRRAWAGHGKWALRALRRCDPALAAALLALTQQGDRAPLLAFAQAALAPVGGPLFEGYQVGG